MCSMREGGRWGNGDRVRQSGRCGWTGLCVGVDQTRRTDCEAGEGTGLEAAVEDVGGEDCFG